MRQLRLNQTYYKVLLTLKLLNDLQYYPLNEGIFKILNGKVDEETRPFSAFPTFGTLSSYTSEGLTFNLNAVSLWLYRKIFDSKATNFFVSAILVTVCRKFSKTQNSFS